jgi:hypothetical protein
VPGAVVREAVAALADAGWEAEADDELGHAVHSADGTPAAAGLWAERRTAAGAPDLPDALGPLADRHPESGREAVLAYLEAVGRGPAVAAACQRFSDLLRADTDSWARAGAALVEAGQRPLATAWLADWPTREGVQPWMLKPLADALRALDRDAEAEAVCRGVVAMPGGDDGPADFRAWLALTAAVAGDTQAAADHLAAVDPVGRPDGTRLVLAMAEALAEVQRADAAGKKAAFASAKDRLRVAAGACAPADVPPGAARWYRRAAGRLASDAGTLGAALWAAGQRLRPWVRGR